MVNRVIREAFGSEASRLDLKRHDLDYFDALWHLEADWYETPNTDRDGLSGVVTYTLDRREGIPKTIFIKRQQDHMTFNPGIPFGRIPTFFREYKSIEKLTAAGVPVIEPLYFGWARADGHDRAILVSYALTGFISLEEWLANGCSMKSSIAGTVSSQNPISGNSGLFRLIASVMARIHDHHMMYGCLYAKHIFVMPDTGEYGFQVKLLDLENVRRVVSKTRARQRDLDQFLRSCPGFSRRDHEAFMQIYATEAGLNEQSARRLVNAVLMRIEARRDKHSHPV